jgi:hypothetical protein
MKVVRYNYAIKAPLPVRPRTGLQVGGARAYVFAARQRFDARRIDVDSFDTVAERSEMTRVSAAAARQIEYSPSCAN